MAMIPFQTLLTELKLTVQYHAKLNPKIWHKGKIDPKDRKMLVDQAYAFVDFCDESKDSIKDIVFTGSCANYNYTKYSDVDVHILMKNPKTSDERLHEKKDKWEHSGHSNLKMKSYPVELYIQDIKSPFSKGQGVYSLLNDQWVNIPEHLTHVDILKSSLTKTKIEHYIAKIKKLIKSDNLAEIKKFKENLHNKRKAALEKSGEFSIENIIYKELRNRGLIDKLNAHKHQLDGSKIEKE